MKKSYETPELDINIFTLNNDILSRSSDETVLQKTTGNYNFGDDWNIGD